MPKLNSVNKPKLWIPKVVSYDGYTKRGYVQGGTKAFVLQGTRLGRGLKREEKQRALSKIATDSEFFIKPLSKRNWKIRAMLEKYGIRVEKIVQDLKNGTALFQKEGFAFNSSKGIEFMKKNPQRTMNALQETMARMIILGVYHGHPHLGNFAVTKNGEIIVLDLGKATMEKPKIKRTEKLSKAEAKKIAQELNKFYDCLTLYYYRRILGREPELEELNKTKERYWHQFHGKMVRVLPQMQKISFNT